VRSLTLLRPCGVVRMPRGATALRLCLALLPALRPAAPPPIPLDFAFPTSLCGNFQVNRRGAYTGGYVDERKSRLRLQQEIVKQRSELGGCAYPAAMRRRARPRRR
jgi:hypothetical protein